MNQQIEGKLRSKGYEFLEMPNDKTDSAWDKPFHCWFWECVLGNSSEEYRREFWREAHRGHTIGPSPKSFGRPDISAYSGLPYSGIVESDLVFRLVFLMIPGSFFWLLRHVLRRTLRKLRRPSYYERERDRRIELGRQRRSITLRTTVNAKPSFDDIRAAWNGERHTPEGALRLGGLMEDLECFVCNLTIGNAIEGYRGRRGGIKRLLQDKAPDLFDHYTSLMRYKSIARRFRQACGLRDPEPTDAVLPLSSPPRKGKVCRNWSEQISRVEGAKVVAVAGDGNAHENWSEQIACGGDATAAATDGEGNDRENWSEQISRTGGDMTDEANNEGKVTDTGGALDENKPVEKAKPLSGVKSWVLDGFVFGYKNGCWLEKESFEAAVRILRTCENSVISLEAALALEIDPNCVTAEFEKVELEREKRAKREAEKLAKRTRGKRSNADTGTGLKHMTVISSKQDVELVNEKIGPNESCVCRDRTGDGRMVDERIGPNESRACRDRTGDGRTAMVSCRVLKWLKGRITA